MNIQHQLPDSVQEEFIHFIENHPPKDFSLNLTRTLLQYVLSRIDFGFREDTETLIRSSDALIDLLLEAEEQLTMRNTALKDK